MSNTPAEKAKELVDKYEKLYNPTWSDEYAEWDDKPIQRDVAKACALICIGEIIAAGPSQHTLPDVTNIHYDEFKEAIRFWEQVKQEINKP